MERYLGAEREPEMSDRVSLSDPSRWPCSDNTGSLLKLERYVSFPEERNCGVRGVVGDGGETGEACDEELSSEDNEILRRSLGEKLGWIVGSDNRCASREGAAGQDEGNLSLGY